MLVEVIFMAHLNYKTLQVILICQNRCAEAF